MSKIFDEILNGFEEFAELTNNKNLLDEVKKIKTQDESLKEENKNLSLGEHNSMKFKFKNESFSINLSDDYYEEVNERGQHLIYRKDGKKMSDEDYTKIENILYKSGLNSYSDTFYDAFNNMYIGYYERDDESLKESTNIQLSYEGPIYRFGKYIGETSKKYVREGKSDAQVINYIKAAIKDDMNLPYSANITIDEDKVVTLRDDTDRKEPHYNGNCEECGTKLTDGGFCPSCDDGYDIEEGASFTEPFKIRFDDYRTALDITDTLGFGGCVSINNDNKGYYITGDETTLHQFIHQYNKDIGELDLKIEESKKVVKESYSWNDIEYKIEVVARQISDIKDMYNRADTDEVESGTFTSIIHNLGLVEGALDEVKGILTYISFSKTGESKKVVKEDIISNDYYVEYADDDYELFNNKEDAIKNAKSNNAKRVVLKHNYNGDLDDSDFDDGLTEDMGSDSQIYLFPKLTAEDKYMLRAYNLKYLGSNHGAYGDENNDAVEGTLSDLENYTKNYLDYELHPDYLYDKDDFAGDVVDIIKD